MAEELKIGQRTIRLVKADVTEFEADAFVYYARPDLALGAGFGTAIAMRGGRSIQEELKPFGEIAVGEAVVTSAGEMKARYIIHAVGPRFQEEDTEGKLRATVRSALKRAEEKGIEQLAFPPMGAGFYGVPLDLCARVMTETVSEHLEGETGLKEVIFCVVDAREYAPFEAQLTAGARA